MIDFTSLAIFIAGIATGCLALKAFLLLRRKCGSRWQKVAAVDSRKYGFEGQLVQVMEQDKLYLNPTLTVKDLAKQLGTNRTYLSDYFVKVLNTSFYDYINTLRIERMSLPLMEQNPELTLEAIAAKSGFQSISTFRRSFQKLKGISPSEYKRKLQSLE